VAPLHAVGLRRVVLLEQPKERGARALFEPAVPLCGAVVTVAFLNEEKLDQKRALAESLRVKERFVNVSSAQFYLQPGNSHV
jgi:hypothetical protein